MAALTRDKVRLSVRIDRRTPGRCAVRSARARRQRCRRGLLAAAVIGLGIAAAACAPAPAGHVAGFAYLVGGPPAAVSPRPMDAEIWANATGTRTQRTWSTHTAADGSFAFDLPAGEYELYATLPGASDSPIDAHEVTVAAGATTNVQLTFTVP